MDFNGIIKRAIGIITKPVNEWEVIKNETMSIGDMFMKYAIWLAAIPAVAGFIGFALIGVSLGAFGSIRYPIGYSLIWAILTYVLSLAGAYVLGMIVDALAPSFGSPKDINRSMKVVVFSYTAAWIAGIFYIIPSLSILAALAGLYSLYLLYLGLKSLKETPQDKLIGYLIVSIVIAGIIFWFIGFITATIVFRSAFSAPIL